MKRLALILAVMLMAVAGCASQPTLPPTPVAPTSAPSATPIAPTRAPSPTPVPPTSPPAPTFVPPTPTYTVEVTQDVEYTTPLQPDVPVQKLDVYAPSQPGPWPVVLLVHSTANTKHVLEYTSLGKELAGRGAVVFVPNWRAYTSLEVTKNGGQLVREASEELTCAVRFARAKAADYGGDPGRVTLVSHSEPAGMRRALTGDDSALWEAFASSRGGPPQQVECVASGVSADVDAFVGFGVEYTAAESLKEDDPDLWALCSPYANIGKNPSLVARLVHAEQDIWIPVQESVDFCGVLVDAGYDATLTTFEGEGHRIPFSGPGREAFIQAVMESARR